jgi:hypothetical protein
MITGIASTPRIGWQTEDSDRWREFLMPGDHGYRDPPNNSAFRPSGAGVNPSHHQGNPSSTPRIGQQTRDSLPDCWQEFLMPGDHTYRDPLKIPLPGPVAQLSILLVIRGKALVPQGLDSRPGILVFLPCLGLRSFGRATWRAYPGLPPSPTGQVT